jgi:hypothetical protein
MNAAADIGYCSGFTQISVNHPRCAPISMVIQKALVVGMASPMAAAGSDYVVSRFSK